MAPSFDCVSNVLENGSHFESWDNQGDTRQTHLSLSFFAAEEVVPLEAAHYKRVLSSCSNVDKERMFGCYNLIQEIMIENSFTRSKKNQISGGSLSAAKTPTGVLDAGPCFSSWDSDKTSATRTSSISVEPYAKRRKLNEFCSSVFVSEVQPCWQKAVVFGGDEDFQCTPWNEGKHFGHVRDASFRRPIKFYFGSRFTLSRSATVQGVKKQSFDGRNKQTARHFFC
ncbi:hypothetical protein SUGI_0599970 [Cryptomeria japonica]|nr:hypothetical protein SUGI_0599970 [Cryptomeria japonica]